MTLTDSHSLLLTFTNTNSLTHTHIHISTHSPPQSNPVNRHPIGTTITPVMLKCFVMRNEQTIKAYSLAVQTAVDWMRQTVQNAICWDFDRKCASALLADSIISGYFNGSFASITRPLIIVRLFTLARTLWTLGSICFVGNHDELNCRSSAVTALIGVGLPV
jgi:hypothetical protein